MCWIGDVPAGRTFVWRDLRASENGGVASAGLVGASDAGGNESQPGADLDAIARSILRRARIGLGV